MPITVLKRLVPVWKTISIGSLLLIIISHSYTLYVNYPYGASWGPGGQPWARIMAALDTGRLMQSILVFLHACKSQNG